MTTYENVRSTIKPEPVRTDEYSVYVNTDIQEVSVSDEDDSIHTEYEYKQIRYTKDEYIQCMLKKQVEEVSELSNILDVLLINILEGED